MQQPLQITYRGIDPSDFIEARIHAKAAELERFSEDITSCRVTVEVPHQHKHKGSVYSVRLDIHVPDKEIVVGRDRHNNHAHEDVYVAIRDSFDAAIRQLEDYVRKRRGKVKRHSVPDHGRITKLFRDDGYGFVQMPDGTDVYFHENSLTGATIWSLKVGDEMRVVIAGGEGYHGPQASTASPIGKHHLVAEPGR